MTRKQNYVQGDPAVHRERASMPSKEVKSERKAIREAEAIVAMAEERSRQNLIRANMEKQRAARLAKEIERES